MHFPVVDTQHALISVRYRLEITDDDAKVIGDKLARRSSHGLSRVHPGWLPARHETLNACTPASPSPSNGPEGRTSRFQQEDRVVTIGSKFVRVQADALLVLAVAASFRQDHRAAIRLLEASLANWQIGDRWGSARTLVELGRACLAVGDTAAAAAHVATSLEVCRDLGDPWAGAGAVELTAVLALRSNRRAAAAQLVAAAAQVRDAAELVASPRERTWLAEHIDVNLHVRSRAGVTEAHRAGRRVTLAAALDLALAEVHRARRTGLTGREYQVARLVALARTNRQIANELQIAVPTVERHVTNILQKLVLRSRAEVVRWMITTGEAADAEPVARGCVVRMPRRSDTRRKPA